MDFIKSNKKLIGIIAGLVVIICVAIALFSCGEKGKKTTASSSVASKPTATPIPTNTSTPTPSPTNTPIPTPTPDPHIGMVRSPLDNKWVDAKYENMRPLSVMFNNIKQGAPQVGITDAGVIYECLVEGGITRLMGLFTEYDKLGNLGSIRSAREYYVYWAMEYDSIYAHIGGPQKYVSEILKNIDDLDGIRSYGIYFYVNYRVSPHNEFSSGEKIVDGIKRYNLSPEYTDKYPGKHFIFTDDENPELLKDGMDAYLVKPGYEYNYPSFTYNEEDGLYYRNQFGDIHIDETTGKQLTCKNILIQYADYYQLDHNGYLSFKVEDTKSGYYITNGKAIKVTWKKNGMRTPTKFYDSEGNEIELNSGTTWICVCPTYYENKNTVISK